MVCPVHISGLTSIQNSKIQGTLTKDNILLDVI